MKIGGNSSFDIKIGGKLKKALICKKVVHKIICSRNVFIKDKIIVEMCGTSLANRKLYDCSKGAHPDPGDPGFKSHPGWGGVLSYL